MDIKRFLALIFLVVAEACASEVTNSLAILRIRTVNCTIQETVLLSSEESAPKPKTALSGDRIHRIYIHEGDNLGGFLVAGVDKTRGEVVLRKDGNITTIRSIPSGIQTNYWADVVSTQNNFVMQVKVGDSLVNEWTIASISESGVVTASNKVGKTVVIEQENKMPQPTAGGDEKSAQQP
jgi:hypothetical protein